MLKNEEELKRSAERLAELLKENNLSQADFVRATGESKANVSRWLSGERSIPQWSAQRIAVIYKVSPAWLMGFDCDRIDVGWLISLLDAEDRARILERINTLLEDEKYQEYLKNLPNKPV